MIRRERHRVVSAVLLLVLFVSYLCNTALFTHSHIVDGRVVTHSHPYSQAPDTGTHTHTSAQYAVIAQLSVLLAVIAAALGLSRLIATSRISRDVAACDIPDRYAICGLSLRGPPVC